MSCRLLSLHVQEAHDSFFREMAKREPMYECLVEGCSKKFKGDFQRFWHLVNVHHFPKTFRFHIAQRAHASPKRGRKGRRCGDKGTGSKAWDVERATALGAGVDEDADTVGGGVMLDVSEESVGGRGEGAMSVAGRGEAAGADVCGADMECEVEGLCAGMRRLAPPSRIHFGRKREKWSFDRRKPPT